MDAQALPRVVAQVAHALPSQGPIGIFIHHNPLHAFEHLPFEEATVAAGRELGCEPYMPETFYRAQLVDGRVTPEEIAAVVADDLGSEGGATEVTPGYTRGELWRRVLVHGIPEAHGHTLNWLLHETSALERVRDDLPLDAREALLPDTDHAQRPSAQRRTMNSLWQSCLAAVRRSGFQPARPAAAPIRHRDLLLAVYGVDVDPWFQPVVVRFVGAFLDQGLAHWAIPGRELGMYRCFLELYGRTAARAIGPWAVRLPAVLASERAADVDAEESLARSLVALGIPEAQWGPFLTQEALGLRGWAGMVRQLEERPDRVPRFAVPATLMQFLAVRMLLLRVALDHALSECTDLRCTLAELRTQLTTRLPQQAPASDADLAWPLFQTAQLCGMDAGQVAALSAEQVAAMQTELADLEGITRRRLLHEAYERHLRQPFHDALLQHAPTPAPEAPDFQAIFCIDEREESFRRHLEEAAPSAETLGAAGFFGVAMYFQGAADAHPRPLCPVAIEPTHYVAEHRLPNPGLLAAVDRAQQRVLAWFDDHVHRGSRTLVRGTAIMTLLGTLAVIPLVLRVLFPWLARRSRRARPLSGGQPTSRLAIERTDAQAPIGRYDGFTIDEMTDVVRQLLVSIGVADRLSKMVLVIGHGSTSLNNPHESAHDCGACGGGQGGANARAFAQMANEPRVRAKLANAGLHIPPDTWFVGGQRNTASNEVVFYDVDAIPAHGRAAFKRTRQAFERARTAEAHERCRRFDAVPDWLPARLALLHVETRSADLAQPRPEYGHATNAFCVVGRRARTRNLFMDRRAFLVSYDPTRDLDGSVLADLLGAVVPVCAGINLEYLFGYFDPIGYGSGTKLPHNVTALIGVMDGAQSDLRTGLPWQMLEIHEPVRLSIAVESRPETLLRILRDNDYLRRLVDNSWIYLACLDPASNALHRIDASGAHPLAARRPLQARPGGSRAVYAGRHGPLAFTRMTGDTAAGTPT